MFEGGGNDSEVADMENWAKVGAFFFFLDRTPEQEQV